MQQLLARAKEAGVRCIPADDGRLTGLSPKAPHQGVVATATANTVVLDFEALLDGVNPQTLVLVLDGVTDPRNLGACMRTAAAAGADAVIVPRDRSAGLGGAASKAASGAEEAIALIAVTNLARALRDMKDAGIWVIGADAQAGRSLYEIDLKGPRAWVLGAEDGMRRLTRETCDELASIPMSPAVESLNVSVATGIVLFETQRQRGAAVVA
jgi:23S rRNA (guanosine2251-2'-O)-methyltransferase